MAMGSRSLEAGGLRNTVPDEHLEEIEAIKRYEVCYESVLWGYHKPGSSDVGYAGICADRGVGEVGFYYNRCARASLAH